MKTVFKVIKSIYQGFLELFLHRNFYYIGVGLIVLVALSFVYPFLLDIAFILAASLAFITLLQVLILVALGSNFSMSRKLTDIFSLGEKHEVEMTLENNSNLSLNFTIYESLPYQLGIRENTREAKINAKDSYKYSYSITPTVRGIHEFGNTILFMRLKFPLAERKLELRSNDKTDVYPSIIQMKKFELYASKRMGHGEGLKRIRKLGHGSEFEQIKAYVPGDDPRTINWKASARAGGIMTNHYQEERSQPVYQVLDSSRVMKMPFKNLTLLDHSINASLALSNIILKKSDKAGLISFDKTVHTVLEANNSHYQLKKFLKSLYNQKISSHEGNYEMLYLSIRRYVKKRSFLMLYTNFESVYALRRALPQLKAISKRHLLLVVLFENTELTEFSQMDVKNVYDIYDQTISKKLILEKELIHNELDQHGIMNLTVTTETLTADVINKYLEVKSRGAI